MAPSKDVVNVTCTDTTNNSKPMIKLMTDIIDGKPLDARDIKNLANAKAEMKRLRKLMMSFGQSIESESKAAAAPKKKKMDRIALNEGEHIKDYVKRPVRKGDDIRKLIHDAIKPNVLFEHNSEDELTEIIDVFQQVSMEKGKCVIKQGDPGATFYVVESGELSITVSMGDDDFKQDVKVGFYNGGDAFGELALIYGSPRAATIDAMEDCKLWSIERSAFRGVVGQYRQRMHSQKLEYLAKVQIGDKIFGEVFGKGALENMAIAVTDEEFQAGETIIREGEVGDTFYMIVEGSVDVFKKESGDKRIASLGSTKFFGHMALLGDATRNSTCIASNKVKVYVLTNVDFTRMLGSLQDILDGKISKADEVSTSNKAKPDRVTLALDELEILNTLGEGAFGKVRLVKAKKTGTLYALKAQGKDFIVNNEQQTYVVNEFKIMNQLNHPNILSAQCAMQDKKYIYFLLDVLPGGELMNYLGEKDRFPEDWTKFYSASVLLAFTEIHPMKIAYRDLKPENLVLDAKGYCIVVDFGLAKKCEGPTWTFCGTPDYLAPEIIRGTGHDWGVDYWGLGILLYELTNGYAPFFANDPTKTAKKILAGRVRFPPNFSEGLKDLIQKLLKLDQSKRFGRYGEGTSEVMKHRFFSGFDWDGLLEKRIPVPVVPTVPADMTTLGSKEATDDSATLDSAWWPSFEE